MSKRPRLWLAAALMVLVLPTSRAAAQLPARITVAGEVLWIAGQHMLIAAGDRTLSVDLSEVPLDTYLAVQPGARVRVTGLWTEGERLIATSLTATPGIPGPAERAP